MIVAFCNLAPIDVSESNINSKFASGQHEMVLVWQQQAAQKRCAGHTLRRNRSHQRMVGSAVILLSAQRHCSSSALAAAPSTSAKTSLADL
jgi:hypothetical protein